jgi:predicted secreted protein
MFATSDRGNGLANLRLIVAMIVLIAGTFAWTPAARADIISISGATFIQQCPCNVSGNLPNVNKGVLVATDVSKVYAAVNFPASSKKICSVSLVYQDINAGEAITARLLRKAFAVGSNPFNNPTVIATVSSAPGVVNTVRKTTTTTIASPTINANTGFYYVEVSLPTINLNLLGVQIDHRPTCP